MQRPQPSEVFAGVWRANIAAQARGAYSKKSLDPHILVEYHLKEALTAKP
jgi:hypothetical protein